MTNKDHQQITNEVDDTICREGREIKFAHKTDYVT